MSEYHQKEVLNAGTLGTYRVHSLFTRISSEGDLEPEGEEPFKYAVALHAHEFTHYLHNLTTIAGVDSLTACFWLVVPFVRNADEHGYFTAPEGIEEDENLKLAFKAMNCTRGTVELASNSLDGKWPVITEWEFGKPVEDFVSLTHSVYGNIGNIPVCTLRVIAKSKAGAPIEMSLRPGLDFISEGVAYEIEREQCRLVGISGRDLDSQTPSYPYLTYRPLVEHFVGRETTAEERIRIGSAALLTFTPSASLFLLCSAMRQDFERADGEQTVFERATNYLVQQFQNYRARPDLSPMVQIREIMGGSEDLRKGVEVYGRLLDKGLDLRVRQPMMELSLIKQAIAPSDFNQVASELLEHLVCQEKVGLPHHISWIGAPGSIAEISDEELQRLSVLQTSIHYLQQHFTKDGRLGNTADLPDAACPFEGACPIQANSSHPEMCSKKPWQVSAAGGKGVCWYEAGRLSLRLDGQAIKAHSSTS